MTPLDYHIISRWRVEGTCQEVSDVLDDACAYVHWWPSVYVDVQRLEATDRHGPGTTYRLLTRGWLPYTLTWHFRITESHRPYGWALEAWGDLMGRGIWTFSQDGRFVEVTYDWTVRPEKPLLRRLSMLLKPVFVANHRWAMRQGEKSLKRELARRREARNRAVPESPTLPQGVPPATRN